MKVKILHTCCIFSSKPSALIKKFGSIDFLMLFFKSVNISCKLKVIEFDGVKFKSGTLFSLSTLFEQPIDDSI